MKQGVFTNSLCIEFSGNKYGNRLVYVAIAVNTTLSPATLGYSTGLPIYREWEDFVNREVFWKIYNISIASFETLYIWLLYGIQKLLFWMEMHIISQVLNQNLTSEAPPIYQPFNFILASKSNINTTSLINKWLIISSLKEWRPEKWK